jgi:peptidoglycan/LPS O-acetylase OafA/YrhL
LPTQTQQLHVNPASHHRFHLLDALRGIAAAFVMNTHMSHSLWLPTHGAFLAVDLFFCLSGFVIAFAYEKRLTQGMVLRDFMIARWIRLYPLYLLGTIVGLAFFFVRKSLYQQSAPGDWVPLLLLALLMLPNFATPIPFPLNPPSWSLFAELSLNAIYAALVRLKVASNLLLTAMALLSLAVLFRWIHLGGSTLDVGHYRGTILIGLARAGFEFPIGVLAYRLYIKRHVLGATQPFSWSAKFSAVTILAALLILIFLPLPLLRTGLSQLLGVVFVVPCLVYFGAWIRLPHHYEKACTFLGDMSYPLYALHFNFVFGWPLFDRVHRLSPKLSHLSFPVLVVVFGYIANWLGKHYDLPARRFLSSSYSNTLLRLRRAATTPG